MLVAAAPVGAAAGRASCLSRRRPAAAAGGVRRVQGPGRRSPGRRRAGAPRPRAEPGGGSADGDDLAAEAEAATRKWGLEAGLWKALTGGARGAGGAGGATAKDLLKRYGGAYLLTSISFALVSFAACYAAVSAGVDMGALLSRLGLTATDATERAGTAAVAYAAHKALSPVRFPPTVALTPVVARWLGRGGGGDAAGGDAAGGGGGDGGK